MTQVGKNRAIAPRAAGAAILPTPASRPKKTRAKAPRVRSGCISCKMRRTKCDEGKPVCRRCENDGFDCGGYMSQPIPTTSRSARTPAVPGRPLLAPKNPQPAIFSRKDVVYFDLFRFRLVFELSGFTHSDFWFRIVLCETVLDKCAQEIVLAIGALSAAIRNTPQITGKSSTPRRPSALHPWSPSLIANDDHEAAVCHYVKALSIFRGRLEAGVATTAPRSAFILSMLFITFEMLQGDMDTADSLITNSINILRDTLSLYRRDTRPKQATLLTCRSTMEDMKDIEHLLPLISIMSGYTPFLRSQPANIQLWDPLNGVDLPYSNQYSISKLEIQWTKFSTRATAFIGGTTNFHLLPPSTQRDIEEQQQALVAQLSTWKEELDLWLTKKTPYFQQPIHRRTLRMIRIQHQMLFICVSSCLGAGDLTCDAYEADFHTLLMRCAIYLEELPPLCIFTLTTFILSPLIVVVTRCRVHEIRMMAVGLLRQLKWREGAWEPRLMLLGKLGGVLMEERGRDGNGFIAPECRWFLAGAEWDAQRRFLVARYTRVVPDEANQPVIKTLLVDPEICPEVCADIGCFEDHDAERESLLSRYKCQKR